MARLLERIIIMMVELLENKNEIKTIISKSLSDNVVICHGVETNQDWW